MLCYEGGVESEGGGGGGLNSPTAMVYLHPPGRLEVDRRCTEFVLGKRRWSAQPIAALLLTSQRATARCRASRLSSSWDVVEKTSRMTS